MNLDEAAAENERRRIALTGSPLGGNLPTSGGVPLTDELLDKLADEAERGYEQCAECKRLVSVDGMHGRGGDGALICDTCCPDCGGG